MELKHVVVKEPPWFQLEWRIFNSSHTVAKFSTKGIEIHRSQNQSFQRQSNSFEFKLKSWCNFHYNPYKCFPPDYIKLLLSWRSFSKVQKLYMAYSLCFKLLLPHIHNRTHVKNSVTRFNWFRIVKCPILTYQIITQILLKLLCSFKVQYYAFKVFLRIFFMNRELNIELSTMSPHVRLRETKLIQSRQPAGQRHISIWLLSPFYNIQDKDLTPTRQVGIKQLFLCVFTFIVAQPGSHSHNHFSNIPSSSNCMLIRFLPSALHNLSVR